jgi:hypothetical protein
MEKSHQILTRIWVFLPPDQIFKEILKASALGGSPIGFLFLLSHYTQPWPPGIRPALPHGLCSCSTGLEGLQPRLEIMEGT